MKRLAVTLVCISLLEACTFQFGAPVGRPTERVIATQTREVPTYETEASVVQDDIRVRVEAHRLCSAVSSRSVERRTRVRRTLTRANVAKTIVVIGVLVTAAGVAGAVRPSVLSNATDGKIGQGGSRIAAITLGAVGAGVAIGGAVPLIAARRPGVRVETATVEDPPSAPERCASPHDDSGLAIELAFDGRRVPVGLTDASGVLEFSADEVIPHDQVGTISMLVDGVVTSELDVTPLYEARAANAIASCTSGTERECEYLSLLRNASYESSRAADIAAALALRDWQRLDLAACATARVAADCADVTTFVERNPNDAHAAEAIAAIRRGRIHAIELRRAELRR